MPKEGFTQLSSAMVVSKEFRESLLHPDTRQSTIEKGYLGQTFQLTEAEIKQIVSIGETQLEQFAAKLNELKKLAPSIKRRPF